MSTDRAPVIATYSRSGFVEGEHRGHVVIVGPDGGVLRAWGDPELVIFPRSSNKPAQAIAMVEAGLDLPEDLTALSASSHSGEAVHLAGVQRILADAGLGIDALQTPPDFPLDRIARDEWSAAGHGAEPIAMNCSGKHAAMLATCVVNGWPIDSYLDPGHPLQLGMRATLESLAGEPVAHVGVDGCGAPVMAVTLAGLARMLSNAVQQGPGEPGGRVTRAMAAYPEIVGGSRRDVTAFMRAVPGLVAKDGAEGVYVASLPDGTAVAVKSLDGSDRARQVALAAALATVGVAAEALAGLQTIPLLGGGHPVGEVASPLA
jgi:L-asparaginase II